MDRQHYDVVEKPFSIEELVKTYLRSTVPQVRPSTLAIQSSESQRLDDVES